LGSGVPYATVIAGAGFSGRLGMKKTICAVLLAGSAAVFAATSANAAVGISFNFGDISVAYTDGYYDNHHHWHQWRRGEWDNYRRHHHYYHYRHNEHRRHGYDHHH
jgi:hypothetical protein